MNFSTSMHLLRTALLIIGLILMINPLHAQKEYDLLGKGARAAGMAYAFNAIADDATAMSWNPAGMVQIKKPEIALVNSLTSVKREHRLEELEFNPVYLFDYMGFVFPLKLKTRDLVFGICFQNKMNYKYKYTSTNSKLSINEGNSNLKVNAITLSGSYSLNRFISVGFSYNRLFSMGNKVYTCDEYYYTDTTHIYETNINSAYKGNNITAGILLDFTPLSFPLRLALKYENKYALKKDFNEIWETKYRYTYYENESWIYSFEGIENLYIPQILSAGLSYRQGDYLTIACDLDFRFYSGKDYGWNYRWIENYETGGHLILLKDTIYVGENSFDRLYSNLYQYRFGLEYILHPKNGLIPVRAGWKNNPTSVLDYNIKYSEPKRVYAHSTNLGTGFITKNLSFDFAYERYIYERTDEFDKFEKRKYSLFILSMIIYLT